ncbi:MAG: hypothetical protein Ct9H300mP6_17170 [Gammaproteobacteria bacterium]|nr:MAG: hypothetical protein Ct9H300mP6_17170 [Gammaproteobacteria bacterium]
MKKNPYVIKKKLAYNAVAKIQNKKITSLVVVDGKKNYWSFEHTRSI